jgi:hypothetical protein
VISQKRKILADVVHVIFSYHNTKKREKKKRKGGGGATILVENIKDSVFLNNILIISI